MDSLVPELPEDRLTVARDLLTESGSIFVQIGDENVHRVRAVLDEVFGDENICGQIVFEKTTGKSSGLLDVTSDSYFGMPRPVLRLSSVAHMNRGNGDRK
jgi:adenine-specific DNA-methyltransferase